MVLQAHSSQEYPTAGTIAARVALSDDPREQTLRLRQVRYWSTEHLLEMTTERLTGTGKYRHYTENAVYEAALLVELGKLNFPGLLARMLMQILKNQRLEALGGGPWLHARHGTRDVFLRFGSDDGRTLWLQLDPSQEDEVPDKPSMITVNLTKVFARVR